ncbi:MAG: hypothetical protein WAM27_11510 [Nitrososphaeraceae archaeon]
MILVGFNVLAVTMITTTLIGSQASAQNQNVSSANITSADANALYNLTFGEKAYPVVFNMRGGILDRCINEVGRIEDWASKKPDRFENVVGY